MGLNIDQRYIKVGAANVIPAATKQPNDVWIFTFDFADWLEGADTLVSATVSATPVETGGLTVSVQSITPTVVKVLASLGIDTHKYSVVVLATTKGGQTKETELSLRVLNYPSAID